MREIKFRFWEPKTKKMIYDSDFYYIDSFGKVNYIDWDNEQEIYGNLDIIPLQFTGLKDKNGKEIYDGDILNIKEMMLSVVSWNENGHWNLPLSLNSFEVIGNIYENPELLKQRGFEI